MNSARIRLLAAILFGLLLVALSPPASAQDFLYRKRPIFVKVPPSVAVPDALPFCGTLTDHIPLICYAPGAPNPDLCAM